MRLTEIVHLVLEIIRAAHIVDDERIDTRLIEALINTKRDTYIKNELNGNNPFTENATQQMSITLETVTGTSGGLGLTAGRRILRTVDKIPRITEYRCGLAIHEITDGNLLSLPFSYVSYEHLRFVGNNRFNRNFLYTSVFEDRIYVSQLSTQTALTSSNITAIFQDPRQVPGFNVDTDPYPVNDYMVEYIKNSITREDMVQLANAGSDDIADGTGDLRGRADV